MSRVWEKILLPRVQEHPTLPVGVELVLLEGHPTLRVPFQWMCEARRARRPSRYPDHLRHPQEQLRRSQDRPWLP